MSYTGLIKRVRNPAATTFNELNDESAFSIDNEFKAYLYWPLAAVLLAISIASYLVGMYFAS